MVKLNKIQDFLNTYAPSVYAEDYDNVGLLVESKNKDIKKVLITLDIDEAVARDAVEKGCDLIISHHPLIFNPIKRLTQNDSISRTIISLVKNDISLISIHTNFDSVKSGLCDLFLDKIADTKERIALTGDKENGCGRFAHLSNEKTLSDILDRVKNEFNLNTVKYIGDTSQKILKIAVCNGSGADFIYDAKELGADVFVSGDIKYHHARFAYENNISLIEVPHYNAEIIFSDFVKDLLKKEFKNDLDIYVTDKNIDVFNVF